MSTVYTCICEMIANEIVTAIVLCSLSGYYEHPTSLSIYIECSIVSEVRRLLGFHSYL